MKSNKTNQWSLTILRITLACIFISHGYSKLFAAGGFKGTTDFFKMIQIPFPAYSALLVGVVEFAAGLFLLIGLLTRWSSIALIIDMLVALFKVHLKNGFSGKGGYEFVLLILACLFVILMSGSGKLSFGNMFKNKNLH